MEFLNFLNAAVRAASGATLDLLFPVSCVNCGIFIPGGAPPICGSCYRAVPLNAVFFRATGGAPRIAAATRYANPTVRKLINLLKFQSVENAHMPLAALLAEYCERMHLASLLPPGAAMVPIPLHPARERIRGFNQAELIGMAVARHLHMPLSPRLLTRSRATMPQSSIEGAHARRANIKGCFQADSRRGEPLPRSVVLIDDVITSGATMREAADALARAGIPVPLVLAVAIA